jgi:hypothetical protein
MQSIMTIDLDIAKSFPASRLATTGRPASSCLVSKATLIAAGLQGNVPCVVVLNCTMKHNRFADIT